MLETSRMTTYVEIPGTRYVLESPEQPDAVIALIKAAVDEGRVARFNFPNGGLVVNFGQVAAISAGIQRPDGLNNEDFLIKLAPGQRIG
jgi:hypothetical protein